jgi:hypothetical protein
MKKNIFLWILALVITLASAYYQRVTGPTYPLAGKQTIANETIKYKLDRTHSGYSNQEVKVQVANKNVSGTLFWKRYKTNDDWTKVDMTRRNDSLTAWLPAQPSAGKLMYKISLKAAGKEINFPKQPVIIRFKGDVPLKILIPHVLFLCFHQCFFLQERDWKYLTMPLKRKSLCSLLFHFSCWADSSSDRSFKNMLLENFGLVFLSVTILPITKL